MKGGLDLYAYVGNNPLGSSDTWGLSPRDIERLQNLFPKIIAQMVREKRRLPGKSSENDNNNWANACNPKVESWGIGFIQRLTHDCGPPLINPLDQRQIIPNKYFNLEVCDGQATYVANIFNLQRDIQPYDDAWKFTTQEQFGHIWGVGVSSVGEKIWFDPWKEEFSVGKPCPGCKGILLTYGKVS